MAGQHQIWVMDLANNKIGLFAGSGYEAREDGDFYESAFAQPSGLLFFDNKIYVADSESNIIREINVVKKQVTTLVGGDLYDFGDVDGFGDNVRLQHPLGLAKFGTNILIADTYNHKIKILDVKKNAVSTFLGTGKSGNSDGKNPTFWEPSGIVTVGNNLYVADANNNAIRVVDLTTKEAKTLNVKR
jgi:DNA-binding beta-propeller fold protein YncE